MNFSFLPSNIVLPSKIINAVDRSGLINSQPFDKNTEVHTPQGKYTTAHYGVMIPNLPAPFNFLNLIIVVGQPKVNIFRNEHLIKTTAIDTANLLVGTAVGTPEHFNGYSVKNDCELLSNGASLRFANDLLLEGTYPHFHAVRKDHQFNFDLKINATDKIAQFADLAGGLYQHWALLCQYEGFLEYKGEKTAVKGLCTYEYARAANINLVMKYFTYQILNIDDQTQVLLVEILGPLNVVLQQRVYVRSVDDHGDIYSRGFNLTVSEFEENRVTTPNNLSMRLPRKFTWKVDDNSGNPLIEIEGIANRDFKYGMGGGYAGSYQYKGKFRNKSITGTGYIEYLDLR